MTRSGYDGPFRGVQKDLTTKLIRQFAETRSAPEGYVTLNRRYVLAGSQEHLDHLEKERKRYHKDKAKRVLAQAEVPGSSGAQDEAT